MSDVVMQDVFLCHPRRTAVGRFGGTLASVRPDDFAATIFKAVLAEAPDLDPAAIEEVFMGCANQAGEDNRNVARMSSLLAGIPTSVPGTTMNRLCGSGMDAVGTAFRAIKAGEMELALAGGVESMSRIPMSSAGGAWYADPQVAFRQVHLGAERRGEALRSDAQELLRLLTAAGPAADIEALGDSRMLPQSLPLSQRSDIASAFGKLFAAAIFDAPVGEWSGPISSDFGLHIVFVAERRPGRVPELAEIRALVLREFVADRRQRTLDDAYVELLSRYRIVIEKPAPQSETGTR